MKFSKRTKLTLLILLIILNLVLRFPVTPHEIGNDAFVYHALANSISSFGHAEWLIHPLSVFGLYPYSYASAVPFAASGVSQCTGIGMEWTIWLYCAFLGVLSIFTAYLLAGEIKKDDDIFKFLVAFVFSTSQSLLFSATWRLETRGLLIVLLPLFIYLLLKSRTFKLRCGMLSFGSFILLAATHHLFFFVIPIIVIYLAILIVYKLKLNNYKIKTIKVPKRFLNIALLTLLVVLSTLPFYIQNPIAQAETLTSYTLKRLIFTYARYIGFCGIFAILGLLFLLFKQNKSFEEWFLVLILLYIIPLFNVRAYMFQFSAIFVSLLAGIGMLSLIKINASNRKRKIVLSIVIASLLFFVSFSGFFQCWHPNIGGEQRYSEIYMEESTYTTALWIKDYTKGPLISNEVITGRRITAISGRFFFGGTDILNLVHGYVDKNSLQIGLHLSPEYFFWKGTIYKEVGGEHFTWYRNYLVYQVNVDSKTGAEIISKYNLKYYVENKRMYSTIFTRGVYENKDKIYDSEDISIWYLN